MHAAALTPPMPVMATSTEMFLPLDVVSSPTAARSLTGRQRGHVAQSPLDVMHLAHAAEGTVVGSKNTNHVSRRGT